jgi:hypothetical protein
MYHKWRAPKITDDKAWARIQKGDYLWDHSAAFFPEKRYNPQERLVAKPMEKPRGWGRWMPLNDRKSIKIYYTDRIKEAILERMINEARS